ncbi:hypothetical protein Bca4012_024222 [Brassica carinata]
MEKGQRQRREHDVSEFVSGHPFICLLRCGKSWWSKIASHFSGRTDNEIKNHWNTKIKKKLKHLGLGPATHEPMDNITNQTESKQITKPNMCSTIKEGEETKDQRKDDLLIETSKTLIISNNDEELLAKNCKTQCAEEVDIGSLFEMQGNEISVSSSSLSSIYSNISRSESSSYLAEDSISLEQWGLTDMTDPLVPWDLFTNLDDNLFLL